MVLFKKSVFGFLFLAFLAGTIIFTLPMLKDSSLIFSLNLQTFYSLIILSTLILATSIIFAVFKALAFGLILLSPSASLLSPTIKLVATLIIFTLSITYYLSVNNQIAREGFEIPDSLIESSLKLMPQTDLPTAQLPQLPPEQIELLKQNPDLLKQYNIDPKLLDSLPTQTTNSTNELIKPMIKDQLQNIIKPYQNFIAPILALLLFLTLQSFTTILGFFIPPILWLIFLILEKTNFVRFEVEMREVKKLVV